MPSGKEAMKVGSMGRRGRRKCQGEVCVGPSLPVREGTWGGKVRSQRSGKEAEGTGIAEW